jgi:predicted site-specific integrase-resolvase
MSPRNSKEIATEVGIGIATLERWLAEGKIAPPKTVTIGTRTFRMWSEADVKRLKKHKSLTYRKGRGRKAKLKR